MEPCGDSDVKPDLSATLQKLEETKTAGTKVDTLAIPFIDEQAVKDVPITVAPVKDVVPEKKEAKNNEATKTGSAERVREKLKSRN